VCLIRFVGGITSLYPGWILFPLLLLISASVDICKNVLTLFRIFNSLIVIDDAVKISINDWSCRRNFWMVPIWDDSIVQLTECMYFLRLDIHDPCIYEHALVCIKHDPNLPVRT
jgi:hypothetical protein